MAQPGDSVEALLDLVASRRGVDFRDHRRTAIERGVDARLKATGVPDISRYIELLAREPSEIERLIESFVVPVSSFFRDREVFDALETSVIPDQLARTAGPLRTWVAGAATGEEAWSWAMLLCWCRDMFGGPPVEVLGSDLDERSLALARAGRYPAASAADIPRRFNARFVTPDGDDVVIANGLRGCVRFGNHDLNGPALAPREAILASFQIISLRNVLIYLDEPLRRRVLERLHSILKPEGVLVLGTVETLPVALRANFISYPGTPAALHIFQRTS